MPRKYYETMLAEWKLEKCKAAAKPAVRGKRKQEEEEVVEDAVYSRYRRTTGKLMWLLPVRPDLSFTIKELVRDNSKPTISSVQSLPELRSGHKGLCFHGRQS